MSMSYANMIENRHLKKTFILAITISAIVSCLSSANSLHSQIKDRRKRQKLDKEKEASRKARKQERDGSDKQVHQLALSLDQQLGLSADNIGQEYDRNYYYLGQRFAQGDLIAQNRLQEEVIALQRLLINTLQTIYLDNRDITPNEYHGLLNASEAARAGTVTVLRGQCRRLLESATPQAIPQNKRRVVLEDVPPGAAGKSPLYCGYAVVLQQNHNRPLSQSFDRKGRLRCPACSALFDVEQGKAWKITKDVIRTASDNANFWTRPDLWFPRSASPKMQQRHTGYHNAQSAPNRGGQELGEIEFHVANRFIVKCHRENGELACVLCNQNRPVDTVWDSMSELVKHVQRAHDIEEYRQEVDIKEVAE